MLNPVIDGVGEVPTSPAIEVAPVFVIPDPARTAKVLLVPSSTGGVAASAAGRGKTVKMDPPTTSAKVKRHQR